MSKILIRVWCKMFKKLLMMLVSLGVMSGTMSARFMDGPSMGLHYKYQSHDFKADNRENRFPKVWMYNQVLSNKSQASGIHFDYNRPITNAVFLGVGAEVAFALNQKKAYEILTARDTYSGAITLRAGLLMGDRMAISVNGSLVGVNKKLIIKDTFGNTTGSLKRFRPGYAPGLEMTMRISDNMSLGLLYRFEVYKKSSSDGAILAYSRIHTHAGLVKFSYHF